MSHQSAVSDAHRCFIPRMFHAGRAAQSHSAAASFYALRNRRCRCFQLSSSCWSCCSLAVQPTTRRLELQLHFTLFKSRHMKVGGKYCWTPTTENADKKWDAVSHPQSIPLCFKFITNALSRCASTAQLLGDAKCTHTRPPTPTLSKQNANWWRRCSVLL